MENQGILIPYNHILGSKIGMCRRYQIFLSCLTTVKHQPQSVCIENAKSSINWLPDFYVLFYFFIFQAICDLKYLSSSVIGENVFLTVDSNVLLFKESQLETIQTIGKVGFN